MFTTSMTAVAVASLLAGSIETAPKWQTDYRTAVAQAADLKKPVAVFIGEGTNGYAKLVVDGTISAKAENLLKTGYVCVYVDTATESGKALAKAFNLTQGIVISDRTGELQALRHGGKVAAADLNRYLEKFSDVTTVTTTETNADAAVVPAAAAAPAAGYHPAMSTCPGGNCGAPALGGCPGGNCGGSSGGFGRRR